MEEVIVALFALGIGAIFCFYGFKAMRLLFPLWGLVAGFWLGSAIVNAITGDTFFSTTLAIVVGVVFGLVGAVLSYLFYAVAIVAFMGMIGYWLGAGLLIALGVDPGFLTALVGIAAAIVLAGVSLLVRVPKYFLLFFTALAGSALMVCGLLLLGNVVNLPEVKQGVIATVTDQSWIWQILWIGVAAVGLISQLDQSRGEELLWIKEWETK